MNLANPQIVISVYFNEIQTVIAIIFIYNKYKFFNIWGGVCMGDMINEHNGLNTHNKTPILIPTIIMKKK